MHFPEVNLRLPNWVALFLEETPHILPSIEEQMNLVIELSRQNLVQKTGGPFAAVVFDHEGRLVAPGVNIVETSNCSVFHAEIMALILAQNILGRYDLSDAGRYNYHLVASTEPCAMCFGAVPWSGINQLICAAREEDARGIGFDEGAKPSNWVAELNSRGITVLRDVLREDAVAVLKKYASTGGSIYNASRPNAR